MTVVPELDPGTHPTDERSYERRAKVLTLRNAGATITKIAEEIGVSTAQVRRDLARAYRDVLNDTPEDMLARQRSVLLDITRANYPAMMRGDKDAAMLIMRGLEQEAKLFGLYAPTRVLAGVSDVEFANEAARLIESITANDPTVLMKELDCAPEPTPTIEAKPEPMAGPGDAAGAGPDDDDDDWSNL